MWVYVASPGASLLFGAICLVTLVRAGKHIDGEGKLARFEISTTFLNGALLYTCAVLCVGYFFFGHLISDSIRDGFGDGRIAWVFVGVTIETMVKTWEFHRGPQKLP